VRRPALPDKRYFRIGEVSALLGVAPHVVRYWETEFPGVTPDKSPSGQRIYSRSDVVRLLEIHRLVRELGYTFDGARRELQRLDDALGPTPAPLPAPPVALDAFPSDPPVASPGAVDLEAPGAPVPTTLPPVGVARAETLRAGLLRVRTRLTRALDALPAAPGETGGETGGERSTRG